MAVVGNLALLLDVISPRTIVLGRKARSVQSDVQLNFFKKEPNHSPNPNLCASLSTIGFEFERESRNKRAGARGKMNSKVNNAVDYESSSDDEANGNGYGYEDDEETDGGTYDWEKEMRKRLKEIEEMKELEKKAEELQSRMADEDGDSDGEDAQETEEQKRMRVRKELEKVRFLTIR